MQLFPKTLDGFYKLAISAKSSILDVWLGCEKASGTTVIVTDRKYFLSKLVLHQDHPRQW